MARATFVKSARKDNPKHGIKKGDSYYWWAFRTGRSSYKVYSKTKPRRSQLTQSSFYAAMYDLEDRLSEISVSSPEDLESEVQDIISELEGIRDECQSSLDNIPESLQDAPTGELLQSRVDSLDNTISEFESLDFSFDEPDEDQIKEELQGDSEDVPTTEQIAERIDELRGEWLDDKLGEVQDIGFDYE